MRREDPTSETEIRSEHALLAELRAGSRAAFESLVRQHSGRMLSVARRFLGNDHDAQDAVQDAFLSAFKALGTFDGRSRLSTWLHRIAVNAALMKLRSQRRHPEQSIEDLLPRFLDEGHQQAPAAAWKTDPRELERTEIRQQIREQIGKLPESYRTVLLLRDIEEYDTETVAQMLDLSPTVVKVRLHRARQALRTLLDPLMGVEPPC